MIKKVISLFMMLGLVAALSACGIKGKLDLPEDDEGEIYSK